MLAALLTVAIALNPATPAPMTRTLHGGIWSKTVNLDLGHDQKEHTFPAAVT